MCFSPFAATILASFVHLSRRFQPAETRGCDGNIGRGQGGLELLVDYQSLAVAPQTQQTFMIAMKGPDIIWMLVSTSQDLIETQVFRIRLRSLLNTTLL